MIEFLYQIAMAIPVAFCAIGAGIGQGLIGRKAIQALQSQPAASGNISKLCIIGIAMTETVSILGAVVSIMLIMDKATITHYNYATFGVLGIAAAIGLSGLAVGIASSLPAQAACQAIARQPFISNKILNIMLITQTLIMTPNIFGFLVALLIKGKLPQATTPEIALQLFASGLSIGLGSIGPAIGLSMFAYAACTAIGTNKKAFGKIMTFTFVSEAIIETPLIFALLVSLTILTTNMDGASFLKAFTLLSAALCIGISTLAPGYSSGKTGGKTCEQIAYNLGEYSSLSKTSLIALAMVDTFPIYGLLISMMLIFFATS